MHFVSNARRSSEFTSSSCRIGWQLNTMAKAQQPIVHALGTHPHNPLDECTAVHTSTRHCWASHTAHQTVCVMAFTCSNVNIHIHNLFTWTSPVCFTMSSSYSMFTACKLCEPIQIAVLPPLISVGTGRIGSALHATIRAVYSEDQLSHWGS